VTLTCDKSTSGRSAIPNSATVSAVAGAPEIRSQTLPKVARNAAESGRQQCPTPPSGPGWARAVAPERSLCRLMHQRAGLPGLRRAARCACGTNRGASLYTRQPSRGYRVKKAQSAAFFGSPPLMVWGSSRTRPPPLASNKRIQVLIFFQDQPLRLQTWKLIPALADFNPIQLHVASIRPGRVLSNNLRVVHRLLLLELK